MKRNVVSDVHRRARLTAVLALLSCSFAIAQQAPASGTFVLHKFAKAIGTETYSIESNGGIYTLTSHFKFTDRGSEVPLETTFAAETATMKPVSSVKSPWMRVSFVLR